MRIQYIPKSLRKVKKPLNSKIVWNFFRGAQIKEKPRKRNRRFLSEIFEYNNSDKFKKLYDKLHVGEIAGVAICAKSHLFRVSTNWLNAMRRIRLRVFVGILLNKSTNGLVHNILLRCRISKTLFLVRFNLNAPNVISFCSNWSENKSSKHSSFEFRYHESYKKRVFNNKYGSYNKRKKKNK